MMNPILKGSCTELLRRIALAKQTLHSRTYPSEVHLCHQWVCQSLSGWETEIKRILRYLNLGLDDKILEQTWYNELASINSEIEVLDVYFIHPLFRTTSHDILPLRVIQQIHSLHRQTISKPFLLSNGSFSIAPSENAPTLYWLPVTSQLSLLHFPLFFHEFGHQLFLLHKEEMEALIREFQNKLASYLKPIVSQSDDKYRSYFDRASDIVETWREWIEELFCDAVGLSIGGKSYLLAFSNFIRLGGVKEYFVPEIYLSKRSHPVSLLRIRFLSERAQSLGLGEIADQLMNEWLAVSNSLGLPEDYFGYFDDMYKQDITNIIDDMLTEANPVSFGSLPVTDSIDYFKLIESAWENFISNPDEYSLWEHEKLAEILKINEENKG